MSCFEKQPNNLINYKPIEKITIKQITIMSWYISLVILCITIFALCFVVLFIPIDIVQITLQILCVCAWASCHYISCIRKNKFVFTHKKILRENLKEE